MITKKLVRSVAGLLAFAAVVLAPERGEAQRPKTAPTKKPTIQTPTVQPTASEGSTAIAARGRPVSTAAGRAVNAALKTALANASVRNAVRTELLRQLRVRRPLALVDGYWVSAIDPATVYQSASVRPVLLAALGTNGPQLIDAARVSADRIMVAFVPATLGQLVMPNFARDITASIGIDALQSHMTDITGLEIAFFIFASYMVMGVVGEFGGLLIDYISYRYEQYVSQTGPNHDLDGDGIPNKDDKDDDGDGYDDDKDSFPHDASRHICDCGRPVISFGTSAAGDFLPSLVSALNATQAQRAKAVSLGAIVQGQSTVLGLVF